MRLVIQRVRRGRVLVDEHIIAEIGRGFVILLGIGQDDVDESRLDETLNYLVKKIANLRIFEDKQGKMNRSILESGGEAIVVSQFTLYADTRKGRRPSFTGAALPGMARPVVDRFAHLLSAQGVPTQQGKFGAHMQVEIENDGPVTIWMER